MGHYKVREDKICENCNSEVVDRFCSKCGQENIETRQPFYYLFTHFIEDLVHYDGSFWRTMKDLILRPGKIPMTYLQGKRKEYVVPVKLYIFVSFFVFFVGGMLASFSSKNEEKIITPDFNIQIDDQIIKFSNLEDKDSLKEIQTFNPVKNKSVYDSIQKTLPIDKRDTGIKLKIKSKVAEFNSAESINDKINNLVKSFKSNFPKFLFAYLPVFAFILWLFSDKKKWLYFDHGIFTLYYFSFLLISVFFQMYIVTAISDLVDNYIPVISIVFDILQVLLSTWIIIYLFIGVKKMYQYSLLKTIGLGTLLLLLNLFLFVFGIIIYSFLIFLNV